MTVLALAAAFMLTWDIVLAGQIAQSRNAPRPLAALSGIAALLAAPALAIAAASNSALTGRSVAGVDWLWPVTIAVFAAEAMYVTGRRLISPFIGIPTIVYNLMLLAVAITRYVQLGGGAPPQWALALNAAYVDALGWVAGSAALASPYALLVPLIAPAFPARWRLNLVSRMVAAGVAAGIIAGVAAWLPAGWSTITSYDRYLAAQLQERPSGDFAVGLRVLPRLDAPPPPAALRNDLALVDTSGVGVVSVVVEPEGTQALTLDSLERALEPFRRDSVTLVVTLGFPRDAAARYRASPSRYEAARLVDVQRIVRRLHPDYLLPADEPYGRGAAVLGTLPVEAWIRYLDAAARAAHAADSTTKVAVAIASFDAADSSLYVWAAGPRSPIDALGFSLFPAFAGAASLDARFRIADRWMYALGPSGKEQWVFATGGFPAAHGEQSQALAIWAAVAWGTRHSAIKGLVIADAADYEQQIGLRAASGRLRPAAVAVIRATHQLRAAAE